MKGVSNHNAVCRLGVADAYGFSEACEFGKRWRVVKWFSSALYARI
jgi:hypothetical protein